MVSGLQRWMMSVLLMALVFSSGSAWNNNPNAGTPLDDLWSKLSKPTSSRKDPSALLKELDMQSSMEPRLAFARPSMIPTLLTASVAAIVRGATGVFGSDYQLGLIERDESLYSYLAVGDNQQTQETAFCAAPALPLILYESEADADSRLVREACSFLSLTVTMYPIPAQGETYRARVLKEFGTEASMPFLFDPNTKTRISGSIRIIDYLFASYGNGIVPWILQQPFKTNQVNWARLTAAVGVDVARSGAGGRADASTFAVSNPPLVLYGYEGSPFCKVVRERLSALQVPHTVYFTPRGSPNRQRLFEMTGRFQVPFLQDPNTGVDLFESEAIIEYLNKQYAVSSSTVA